MYFLRLKSQWLQAPMVRSNFLLMLFVCLGLLVSVGTVSAADPPTFRQDPVLDLRPVSLNISKDSDGQFELVIGNPTLNEVSMAGEVKLVVPPGLTIYGSILGGSGGTGIVLIPFARDPIKPGSTRVSTLFVRSQITGQVKVTADVTVWPVGNKDAFQQAKLHYEANVTEKSGSSGDPSAKADSGTSGGGCQIGGSPDAGLALMVLMIPALAYVSRRSKRK